MRNPSKKHSEPWNKNFLVGVTDLTGTNKIVKLYASERHKKLETCRPPSSEIQSQQ